MSQIQHTCPYFNCECIVDLKTHKCVSKALHTCNHPRSYFVNLTRDEKETYIFVFEGLERRLGNLQYEREQMQQRLEGIESAMNELWAQLNEMKQDLVKKINRKNKQKTFSL